MAFRVFIRTPTEHDGKALISLHQRSKTLHFPWISTPLDAEAYNIYLERCQSEDFEGLLICAIADGSIIGVANLSQIVRRAFQNAYLGYYVDVDFARQGLMSEGLRLVVDHAFARLDLHRLEANIQPENTASIHLIKRLGFTKEGFSKSYLRINGVWRDHERWAMTREDWTLG